MRLGVDLGGTKTEIVALDDAGREVAAPPDAAQCEIMPEPSRRSRIWWPMPNGELGAKGSVGIAIPGTVSRRTGLVKNANSTWLNGKPFARDLEAALGRPVRLANDANCFALSEASDGAGAGRAMWCSASSPGTGVGGGVVVDGEVLGGAHGIGGEWGHNPLPGMTAEEWAEAPPAIAASAAASKPGERARPRRGIQAGDMAAIGRAEQIAASDSAGGASRHGALDRPAGAGRWPRWSISWIPT